MIEKWWVNAEIADNLSDTLEIDMWQILNRVSQAVYAMINMAADSSPNSALIAIAHSSYLRILLGAVQPPDAALFSAATTPQSNCCINVIDFPHPSTMTTLATNRLMDGDDDNNNNVILIPRGNVIRVNEKRHLNALQRSNWRNRFVSVR